MNKNPRVKAKRKWLGLLLSFCLGLSLLPRTVLAAPSVPPVPTKISVPVTVTLAAPRCGQIPEAPTLRLVNPDDSSDFYTAQAGLDYTYVWLALTDDELLANLNGQAMTYDQAGSPNVYDDDFSYQIFTLDKAPVSFDSAGADTAAPMSPALAYGDKVTRPDDPRKAGYTFLGWFYQYGDMAETRLWDFDQDTISRCHLNLTAHWEAKPKIKYQFKSATEGVQIPDEVLELQPPIEDRVQGMTQRLPCRRRCLCLRETAPAFGSSEVMVPTRP